MSLLAEIQAAVIQPDADLGPILLKLRLLAARLGSAPLEEWVKHESEGYPDDAPLPDYRHVGVAYRASFAGPFGSGYNNAPIPSYLIKKFASEKWNEREMRQSISAIDDMVRRAREDGKGVMYIDASNLILLLQGKVYEGYNCVSVIGSVSASALVEIQQAVRSRVLELTIKLEQSIPDAANIAIGKSVTASAASTEKVAQIASQVIFGNVTNIASSGAGATINVSIQQGDQQSVVDALVQAGIPQEDAAKFGQIVASEQPESKAEPFGKKAAKWFGDNIKKAVGGTWKMGVSVATEVLKQAALKYYGL